MDTFINILFIITGLRVIAYAVVVGGSCLVVLAACGLGAVALATRRGRVAGTAGVDTSKEG